MTSISELMRLNQYSAFQIQLRQQKKKKTTHIKSMMDGVDKSGGMHRIGVEVYWFFTVLPKNLK